MNKYFIIFFVMLTPHLVSADISIREVMYDVAGGDSGYEWIEIYNTGNSPVDIDSWHFYENETHHGLFPDGFSQLGIGERALIVQDIGIIRAEYGSGILLLKSSFSLNNTGETLALSDPDKNIVDSINYSSDDGATGNGNTLQYIDGAWEEGYPTPGEMNTSDSSTDGNYDSPRENKNNDANTFSEKIKNVVAEYDKGYIDVVSQMLVDDPVEIHAWISHTKNSKTTKRLRGVYYINFGDGSIFESDTRIETTHTYQYPGTYELVFEYYSSILEKNIGKEPNVLIKKTINVSESNIAIHDIDTRSGIILENQLNQDVSLGGWYIKTIDQQYVFPKYTTIKKNKTLTVPFKIHGLKGITKDTWISLTNTNNITVSSYTENTRKNRAAKNMPSVAKAPNNLVVLGSRDDPQNNNEDSLFEQYLIQHPEKDYVDFGETQYLMASAIDTGMKNSIPIEVVFGSGLIAILLGIIRARSIRQREKNSINHDDIVLGEIELIE